jgi:hypothetical protein
MSVTGLATAVLAITGQAINRRSATELATAGLAAAGLAAAGLAAAGLAAAGLAAGGLATGGLVATVGTAISELASSEGPGLRPTVARARPEVGRAAAADDIRRANGPRRKRVLRGDFIAAASH